MPALLVALGYYLAARLGLALTLQQIKTKPGQQFTIRRRAYALINEAFAANGIHFAFPTVQVAGATADPATAAAAARQALGLQKAS